MEMNRRTFLAAAGAVAGAGALTACTPAKTEEKKEEKKEEEIVPVRTESFDVVVVGSGIGGFSAALHAQKNGASVAILEKLSAVGGATNFAEVCFGFGSRMLKEGGYTYTLNEILHEECSFHNYRVNRVLWEKLATESGRAIDYFLDTVEPRGGGYMAIFGNADGYMVAHAYKPTVIKKTGETSTKGAGQIAILEEVAIERGIKIFTEYPATKIIMKDNKCVGVYAKAKDGYVQFNAKAVIFCCGGFGNNFEMVSGFGSDTTQMDFAGCSGCTGDAINMIKEVGGTHKGSMSLQMMGATIPLPSSMGDHINQVFRNEPFQLWVNGYGQRFTSEFFTIFTQAANAVDMQDGVFSIMDDASVEFYQTWETESGAGSYILAGTPLSETRSGLEALLKSQPENVFKADTLDDLAKKMGVPADTFKATVAEYNKMVEQGNDVDMGKPAKYLRKIEKAPFYAGRLYTNLLTTVGGIQINENAEVLTKEHKAIPGLYLCGSDADGFSGETYGVNLPGSTQSMGLTYGMIAGENAAAYAKKN